MTAAAVTSEDLEFFIPGNAYVEHSGDANSWPIDNQGRDLALYKNNDFGPAKSYHVVGEYNDFLAAITMTVISVLVNGPPVKKCPAKSYGYGPSRGLKEVFGKTYLQIQTDDLF